MIRGLYSFGKLPAGVKQLTLTPKLEAQLEEAQRRAPPDQLERRIDAARGILAGMTPGEADFFPVPLVRNSTPPDCNDGHDLPDAGELILILEALRAGFVVGKERATYPPRYWIGCEGVCYRDHEGRRAVAPTECIAAYWTVERNPLPAEWGEHRERKKAQQ